MYIVEGALACFYSGKRARSWASSPQLNWIRICVVRTKYGINVVCTPCMCISVRWTRKETNKPYQIAYPAYHQLICHWKVAFFAWIYDMCACACVCLFETILGMKIDYIIFREYIALPFIIYVRLGVFALCFVGLVICLVAHEFSMCEHISSHLH